ncbi:hypothetical protein RKI04_24770 [Citrobacter amalonaticus]|uniref:hypothetical protein n=1 Tax=Citrobacter amalonaticus TaxID=35703 RepID=UPI0028781FFA|nr:hypothetical protein [Citrobacter amalonaticus]MDS4039445.1 hypothetical protein [Citrobacter amalonaticus]
MTSILKLRMSLLFTIMLFILSLFILPCADAAKPPTSDRVRKENSVVPGTDDLTTESDNLQVEEPGYELQTCQKELSLLENTEAEKYKVLKAKYDKLMSDISGYAAVRSDVSSQLQRNMDALWEFRTYRLCAEIKLSLLQGLADDFPGEIK